MNAINHPIERAYMSLSPRSEAGSPCRRARAWLFVALVSAATEFPVTAGFDNANHGLAASNFVRAPAAPVPVSSETNLDWQSLEPSTDIQWTPCYDGQQCAHLRLSLDYLSGSPFTPATAIALRMIPARDHATYKRSVHVNPRGPGGSGRESMRLGGHGQNVESTIIGDSFDVLGFDPCGIGGSMPRLDCFATTPERSMWDIREGLQLLNASHDGLLNFYAARAKAVGDRRAAELRVDKLRRNLRWSALTMRPFL